MTDLGRPFFKMTGSGNDFVVVDARQEPAGALETPEVIQRVCTRGTGVGADGIVFLEPSRAAAIRMRYLNSDGSVADLCGNATLCTTRLAVDLGIAPPAGFTIETAAGVLGVRIADTGLPEVDLEPVRELRATVPEVPLEAGERRIGYALAGVPHLTIRRDEVATVDVVGRGRPLRHLGSLPHGANVNFVAPDGQGGWIIRTYERGVEGETLACGTGAVASAVLLAEWGDAKSPVWLATRSGLRLRVRLDRRGDAWIPSLSGEGRLVFSGTLREV